MKREKQAEIEALLADHDNWDEHIASEEHTQFLTEQEQAELDREIDTGLGLQLISIRLSKRLIEQLKGLAKLEEIGYQPLIRHILTEYANNNAHKLDAPLSASEAADRADKLFVEAIKLRDQISELPALSTERILAEAEYSKALRQSQILFTQAIDETENQSLRQHAQLRMAQIAEVCERELKSRPATKDRKKKESA